MVSESLHTQLLASHQLQNLIKNYKPMHLDTIPDISKKYHLQILCVDKR